MFTLRKKHTQSLLGLGLDIEVPLEVRIQTVQVNQIVGMEKSIRDYCGQIGYEGLTSDPDEGQKVQYWTFPTGDKKVYEVIFHSEIKLLEFHDESHPDSSRDNIILSTLIGMARGGVRIIQKYGQIPTLERAIRQSGFNINLTEFSDAEQREIGVAYSIFLLRPAQLLTSHSDSQLTNRMVRVLSASYEGSEIVFPTTSISNIVNYGRQ